MGVKRSKWFFAGALFIIGTFVSVYSAAAVTGFIERTIQDFSDLKSITLGTAIASAMTNDKCGTLFLCSQGAITLLITVLLMNKKTSQYESPMLKITPKIRTPAMAGQKQHGSAEWLKKSEYMNAFSSYLIDPADPRIKNLTEQGYSDLDFMKNKEIVKKIIDIS
jgi:hypothetical protein